MQKQDFIAYLKENDDNYEFAEAPHEGVAGVFVKNNMYETETHFADTVIQDLALEELIQATHQGKNIEHMTRVTGYFSKVSKWNKGKKGELKDRHRVSEV
ncbi:MAG: hypothetical protein AYK23_05010 [Candidatus Proteinoplasmatales archaeon SG8-5]|nr:MAG: hypothetical protein AYK23_05010 [Candidatus Proteinoplasmatales archaeon SG8-5]